MRHAMRKHSIARRSKCKAAVFRLFRRNPPESSFHFFEQYGVWVHEHSHNQKRDDKERNPCMSNDMQRAVRLSNLLIALRGWRAEDLMGQIIWRWIHSHSGSVSDLFNMKIDSKQPQLRGDLGKFLNGSIKRRFITVRLSTWEMRWQHSEKYKCQSNDLSWCKFISFSLGPIVLSTT